MKRVLLMMALAGGAYGAPQTLLDSASGYWGYLVGPEVRLTSDGLGLGVKAAAVRYAGDHGLLVGGQFNTYQLGTPGEDVAINHYGLLLGYRFMPYAIGHWDSELILGLLSQASNGNAATAYAAELNTAWKVNVHPNIQVGLGGGVLISGQPDSDTLAQVETPVARLIFEFGQF